MALNITTDNITLGELTCGLALKNYLPSYDFSKANPDWLTDPHTGRALELDLYCPELKLGLEYQGPPHSAFSLKFHDSEDAFNALVARDCYKQQRCREFGVTLLIIDYPRPYDPSYIFDTIFDQLVANNFNPVIPPQFCFQVNGNDYVMTPTAVPSFNDDVDRTLDTVDSLITGIERIRSDLGVANAELCKANKIIRNLTKSVEHRDGQIKHLLGRLLKDEN